MLDVFAFCLFPFCLFVGFGFRFKVRLLPCVLGLGLKASWKALGVQQLNSQWSGLCDQPAYSFCYPIPDT